MRKHLRKILYLFVLVPCLFNIDKECYSSSPESLLKKLPRLSRSAWQMVVKNIEDQRQERATKKRDYLETIKVPRSFGKKEKTPDDRQKSSLPLLPEMSLANTIQKKENLSLLPTIPIPLYKQILVDLPRENIAILRNFVPLISSKNLQGLTNEDFVTKIFYQMDKSLHELEHPRLKSHQAIYHLIHLALASRTQTFDRESFDFIQSAIQKNENETNEFFAVKQYKSYTTINICDDKIFAMSSKRFAVGSGRGPAPVGKILKGYQIIRFIEFYFDKANHYEETFMIYEIPKTTSRHLLKK